MLTEASLMLNPGDQFRRWEPTGTGPKTKPRIYKVETQDLCVKGDPKDFTNSVWAQYEETPYVCFLCTIKGEKSRAVCSNFGTGVKVEKLLSWAFANQSKFSYGFLAPVYFYSPKSSRHFF